MPLPFAKNNVLLAPLAGVTDMAFRQICAEQGAGLTYTEMISAKGIQFKNARTYELLGVSLAEEKVGVQLFGREPEILARTAAQLEAEMGDKIAVFDINMGCPAPKIVNNGEGSALMKEPQLAEQIVCRLKKAVSLPVTVKFRKGFDAAHPCAVDFAKRMEQAGADAVTIHGRTRDQFYEGKADWDIIREVKQAVCIPVIGNGDVFSPEDEIRMREQTGCDAVMIARGALGNPFLFAEILDYRRTGSYQKPTVRQKVDMALRQARLATVQKGEQIAMKEMRKHAAWYLKGIPHAARFREQLVRVQTLGELEQILSELVDREILIP